MAELATKLILSTSSKKKNLVDRVAGEQLNTCGASALAPDVCVYVENTCDSIPINHFGNEDLWCTPAR